MISEKSTSVTKTVTVETGQAHAFDIFVNHVSTWWPIATHGLGEMPGQSVTIEPHAGGRWFERDKNGTEFTWGRVLNATSRRARICSRGRFRRTSNPTPRSPPASTSASSPSPRRGRGASSSNYSNLDAYGADLDRVRGMFDSPGGWGHDPRRLRRSSGVCTAGLRPSRPVHGGESFTRQRQE